MGETMSGEAKVDKIILVSDLPSQLSLDGGV